MLQRTSHRFYRIAGTAMLALAAPLFWWVSDASQSVLIDHVLFAFSHTGVEMFAVGVVRLIFAAGLRVRESLFLSAGAGSAFLAFGWMIARTRGCPAPVSIFLMPTLGVIRKFSFSPS